MTTSNNVGHRFAASLKLKTLNLFFFQEKYHVNVYYIYNISRGCNYQTEISGDSIYSSLCRENKIMEMKIGPIWKSSLSGP